MIIKILGTGCDKCDKSYDNAIRATKELGIEAKIEKVTDLVTMMKYGILSTPGIVINEKVVMTGRVATLDDYKRLLK